MDIGYHGTSGANAVHHVEEDNRAEPDYVHLFFMVAHLALALMKKP